MKVRLAICSIRSSVNYRHHDIIGKSLATLNIFFTQLTFFLYAFQVSRKLAA
jgi:hypothetical protein